MTEHLLAALAVIVGAAYLGGRLAARLGQPPVLGEIGAGILLGPSALGAVWPEATESLFSAEVVEVLRPLGDVGLVLFMFLVGLEVSHEHLRGQGRRALVISQVSIVVPFALGVGLGAALHDRLGGATGVVPFALFVGAAMAVTAFPVLARILQETGLDTTRVGALALACAAVDDVTAWCILAAVTAIAQGTGAAAALESIGAALAFVLLMWFGVRRALDRLDHVPIAAAIALALGSAWITEAIGIHAIFGAFVAGAIVPRRRGDQAALANRLQVVIGVVLLPVFFMLVGLSTRIGLVDSAWLWGATALVLAAALAGKLGGATVAARLSGETWRDASTLGILMNTRGLTEIVILSVGLERSIISPTMFTIMVLMALATTFMAVPLLRLVRPEVAVSLRARRSAADAQR